jgi:hypothetical protein
MEKDEIECFSLINFVIIKHHIDYDRFKGLSYHGDHLHLYETGWVQYVVMERGLLVVLGLP